MNVLKIKDGHGGESATNNEKSKVLVKADPFISISLLKLEYILNLNLVAVSRIYFKTISNHLNEIS